MVVLALRDFTYILASLPPPQQQDRRNWERRGDKRPSRFLQENKQKLFLGLLLDSQIFRPSYGHAKFARKKKKETKFLFFEEKKTF